MSRIKSTAVALLIASSAGLFPASADADSRNKIRGRQDRYEDRRDVRDDRREIAQDRREIQRDARELERERRELQRDSRDVRNDRYQVRNDYWDASRSYRRDDNRYRPRRLGRNDTIYRGSDDRYYCKRDDGTTGLILGGIAGGALGNIIAPGGSKTVGTIIGAGAGALIGRAVDNNDIVCR